MKKHLKRILVAVLGGALIAGSTPVGSTVTMAAPAEGTAEGETTSNDGPAGQVSTGDTGTEPVQATEEENNAGVTEESGDGNIDAQDAGDENNAPLEGEPVPESQEPESNTITEQSGLQENSWRYQDGEVIQSYEITPRSGYANAWNKVNGVYMNSNGDPIEGATRKGIDVSEHQGKIDWAKVKASGIDYAIIRCGYGNNFASQDDKYWAYNVSECERLGIPYGVYIYSYALNVAEAKSEAEHVLRLISGHNFSYPVYFDMEDKSTVGLDNNLKGEIAKTFCDAITAAGYKVGVYANLNWWTKYLTSPVFNEASWSKWVAQYNSTCDYSNAYDMWQCTSKGSVAGINGNVDLNFWMNANIDYGGNDGNNGNEANQPEAGTTLAVRRGNQYHIKYTLSDGQADRLVTYGRTSDDVLIGDWDGDGVDTLCVRRGNFYYFKNSLSDGEADVVVAYGKKDDTVYAGDWNGDGIDTLCVRRGNAYYFKNNLSGGEADSVVLYGRTADSVFVGDWNKDRVDTLSVRRGNVYYFKNSLQGGEADYVIAYGKADDNVLVGDWDNDGADTLCVRRNQYYYIKNSIDGGEADKTVVYGRANDTVYAGKWK